MTYHHEATRLLNSTTTRDKDHAMKYADKLAAIKLQRRHARDIKARGLDAALEPYSVPAQRRQSDNVWP